VKAAGFASHRDARVLLERQRLLTQITGALEAPSVRVGRASSNAVKSHIEDFLRAKGWASPVDVAPNFDLRLNLMRQRTVLQVQTGNIARAFYDLMKMQSLHYQGRAECGVLIVPTAEAARTMGSNLAQFERVRHELEGVFYRQITMPVFIAGFE
jgi:hypothetical protein